MTRILIVEDQAILRDSLSFAIDSKANMQIAKSLSDAAEALDIVLKEDIDLVLMDVCTENDSSGIVAARKIKAAKPQTKVVIMTGVPEVTFLDQARDAGADSFVYKNVGTKELLRVIDATMRGESIFPTDTPSLLNTSVEFTDTEMKILRLVCQAKTRKEIAAELFMSEGTVKRYISEILAKTGYDSILRLAVHAVANGNIAPHIAYSPQEEDEQDM